MNKLLAISGGIDSVCLLHMYRDDPEVIVAHFNHGTRPSSEDDEEFVQKLARGYGKKCIVGRAHLGENVSEEKARDARYQFLNDIAAENDCIAILTAHHLDDLVETIAINFIRGTGWRGLTPFLRPLAIHPLFGKYGRITDDDSHYDLFYGPLRPAMFKTDLIKYAAENGLTFREDPTNHEDNYLRNRVREKLIDYPKAQKLKLAELYRSQGYTRWQIDLATEKILDDFMCADGPEPGVYMRHWFDLEDHQSALELLQLACEYRAVSLTRPQLEDFLSAIKTYAPGKKFNLPKDRLVYFTKDTFLIPA